jgi:hypothetical protein
MFKNRHIVGKKDYHWLLLSMELKIFGKKRGNPISKWKNWVIFQEQKYASH